jgi:hypothetical protein
VSLDDVPENVSCVMSLQEKTVRHEQAAGQRVFSRQRSPHGNTGLTASENGS